MKNCIFGSKGKMARVMNAFYESKEGKQLEETRQELVKTLSTEQRKLFNQFDDLTVDAGNALAYAVLRSACGCPECMQ